MKTLQLFLGVAIALGGTLAHAGRVQSDHAAKTFTHEVTETETLEGLADDDPASWLIPM